MAGGRRTAHGASRPLRSLLRSMILRSLAQDLVTQRLLFRHGSQARRAAVQDRAAKRRRRLARLACLSKEAEVAVGGQRLELRLEGTAP